MKEGGGERVVKINPTEFVENEEVNVKMSGYALHMIDTFVLDLDKIISDFHRMKKIIQTQIVMKVGALIKLFKSETNNLNPRKKKLLLKVKDLSVQGCHFFSDNDSYMQDPFQLKALRGIIEPSRVKFFPGFSQNLSKRFTHKALAFCTRIDVFLYDQADLLEFKNHFP